MTTGVSPLETQEGSAVRKGTPSHSLSPPPSAEPTHSTEFLFGEPTPRSTEAFRKWAKKHGIFIHPDVDVLHRTPEMGGYGVVARKFLKPGTIVMSTPSAIAISPYMDQNARVIGLSALTSSPPCPSPPSLLSSSTNTPQTHRAPDGLLAPSSPLPTTTTTTGPFLPVGDDLSSRSHEKANGKPPVPLPPLSRRDPPLVVVLTLLAEICRRHRSLYFPWLQHCPKMEMHLLDLTDDQKMVLGLFSPVATGTDQKGSESGDDAGRGEGEGEAAAVDGRHGCSIPASQWTQYTSISQALRDLRLEERWRVATTEVFPYYPDIWPPQKVTYALFCLCVAHVYSRNFHREELVGREGPYLLPGLDFLNHADPPNTVFQVMGGGRKHERCFTVQVSKESGGIPAGSQIFASYGHVGTARFVTEFQFLSDDMEKFDGCRFSCAQLVELATELHLTGEMEEGETKASSSSSSSSSSTRRAEIAQEMTRRVELMQRMGLLFDEGLFLKGDSTLWRTLSPEERREWEERLGQRVRLAFLPFPSFSASSSTTSGEGGEEASAGGPLPLPVSQEDVSSCSSGLRPPAGREAEEEEVRRRLAQGEEQKIEWRRFRVVAYLLLHSAARAAFDDVYYHQLSAHWNPPQTSRTRSLCVALLGAKLDAVRRVWWEGVAAHWNAKKEEADVIRAKDTTAPHIEGSTPEDVSHRRSCEEEGGEGERHASTIPMEGRRSKAKEEEWVAAAQPHPSTACGRSSGAEEEDHVLSHGATRAVPPPPASHVWFQKDLLYRCLRCEEGVLLQHMMML